jgi:hypothetical protein
MIRAKKENNLKGEPELKTEMKGTNDYCRLRIMKGDRFDL